jgi:protein-disulfide isomerase
MLQMISWLRPAVVAGAASMALLAAVPPVSAQSFSGDQRKQIESIIREYLVTNPEVLQEAVAELEKRQAQAEADRHKTAVSANRQMLFDSARHVTLGNPNGDVTLVEFFDYNCGYCKRALSDMVDLLKSDSKLKVVLKEFPVLGDGSTEAAQVAVAARMQDKSAKKYLDFHVKLLGGRGQADKARALAAAKEAGFDVARIEKDMKSPEVAATIDENMKLAETLGINGTPTYVVGENVVPGAIGLANLRKQIETARAASATTTR